MIKNKTSFWIKVAGWSGLIAAAVMLQLYNMSHAGLFLITLAIVVVFSAYLLATANTSRWQNPSWIIKVTIFSLFFVSLLPTIFLFIAYLNARDNKRGR
ncbi:hypothetical protein FP435_08195 [Lactobacillus sp. PV037]|uniref:hypothetical protein n=1 Tax=unclassified Lactobacillus TaxID=2620435 RepID=UPI00223F5F54|nr:MULTISPECIES: hypothetical protein [unclassified Lactobacillus]QNQ81555.1 hypothetical protein FP433_00055 [Lactobacillus sp. PV012]QNQ84397.1 hypothetical protein FP435_08195 [Lactobacillus sp. PV037]